MGGIGENCSRRAAVHTSDDNELKIAAVLTNIGVHSLELHIIKSSYIHQHERNIFQLHASYHIWQRLFLRSQLLHEMSDGLLLDLVVIYHLNRGRVFFHKALPNLCVYFYHRLLGPASRNNEASVMRIRPHCHGSRATSSRNKSRTINHTVSTASVHTLISFSRPSRCCLKNFSTISLRNSSFPSWLAFIA